MTGQVIWITGLSGAGKTTLAEELNMRLHKKKHMNPKGKIKTTINPIKTLTPRFIQKIVERNKEIK